MNSDYVCSSVNAAWFGSDMNLTSRLGDITVQRRVSSHHQLVCMMASHVVAISGPDYHFVPNHCSKSSSEKLHDAFPAKQHMLGRVWPASHRPCVDSQNLLGRRGHKFLGACISVNAEFTFFLCVWYG